MGKSIKAGVAHPIRVNSKADQFGIEAGFKLAYFNETTKEMTRVDDSFVELTEAVDDVSTHTSDDVVQGAKEVKINTVDGFTDYSTCKIAGNYYRINKVDVDNKILTLSKGLKGAVAKDSDVVLSGRTGTYSLDVTFPDVGPYTIHITNFEVGMDNQAIAIDVTAAGIDDVKDLLDVVKVEVDSIKEQVDTLDEEELNGISEKVTSLASELSAVHSIMKDSGDVYFEVTGDETAIITVDAELTGDTSGAEGVVQYSEYDSEDDVTRVTVQAVSGTFEVDETVNNGTDSTTGKITVIKNNVVNSVIEFVKEIQENLKEGGVTNLSNIGLNLTHMLNGDEKLEDDSDNPTAGKGLVNIFDGIQTNNSELKTAISDAKDSVETKVDDVNTAVTDARASIESKIGALVDEDNSDSLVSKVNAVKDVVDSNKGLLENETYGLAKLLDSLTNIGDLFKDGGDIEVRFDNIDQAISDVSSSISDVATAITDQTAHIDDKFATVMTELDAMKNVANYAVIA